LRTPVSWRTIADMMSTNARLIAWMLDANLRSAHLAKTLQCDRSYVGHLRAGRRKPSRRIANLIERHSATWAHGPIRAAEWDGPYAGLAVANDNDVPVPPAAEGAA